MRSTTISVAILLALASPAFAAEAPRVAPKTVAAPSHGTLPPAVDQHQRRADEAAAPKVDMNKTVTITLAKLQRIIETTQATDAAKCMSAAAQSDVQDLMKQAAIAEPSKK